jgi:hypothetical protein
MLMLGAAVGIALPDKTHPIEHTLGLVCLALLFASRCWNVPGSAMVFFWCGILFLARIAAKALIIAMACDQWDPFLVRGIATKLMLDGPDTLPDKAMPHVKDILLVFKLCGVAQWVILLRLAALLG